MSKEKGLKDVHDHSHFKEVVKKFRRAYYPELKLYWSLASPPSRAVKALLIAGGIEHDEQLIDLSKNEHKSPEMLKINPLGTVPFITI
jgi:hypothetical protein